LQQKWTGWDRPGFYNRRVYAFYTDRFVLPLPAGHRFPMEKYRRLRDQVAAQLPGVVLAEPAAATDGQLALAHTPGYVQSVSSGTLLPETRKAIGFPWSPEMVERARRSVGATVEACRTSFVERVSANLAGGTHHAFRDRGEGFCVFNDAAVAARLMQAEGRVDRVAIVDLDVHQGNGTAAILAGDDSIFTLSLHGERNFPFTKTQSDLDIALPDGIGDTAYLEALHRGLESAVVEFSPGLVIYLAGADPHEGDRLGRLKLSHAGLRQRDRMVLETCMERAIPVAIAMAGGYGRNLDDTVSAHFNTIELAQQYCAPC
jgi:acetoin utilization deacetylase AcuC-like enzyme